MWTCPKCKTENGDATDFCASCGEKKGAVLASASAASTAVKMEEKESRPHYSSAANRYSKVAASLDSWSSALMALTVIIAILVFIASGFTYEYDGWRDYDLTFHVKSLLTGILPAASWCIGGYTVKLVLSGLAVMTEAAYRTMLFEKE